MRTTPNEIENYRNNTKTLPSYAFTWICRKCKKEKFSRKGAKKIKGAEGFICRECMDEI